MAKETKLSYYFMHFILAAIKSEKWKNNIQTIYRVI